MRQIWITKTGAPETLQLQEAAEPKTAFGEIHIAVKAIGINFADIMARLGLYPDSPKLPAVVGYEVAGVVHEVGAGVTSFKPGDRVIGLCRFGGYSERVSLPEVQVFAMPPTLDFLHAAALPVNYITAYQMLYVMGGIKAGDRVLVHSVGGGVGSAAIDLCAIAGAEVIGIASSAKHEALKVRGVAHLIDSRTHDYETEILRLTAGAGVQLILDPVGGDSWAKGMRCLAPTGRLVAFGFSSAVAGKKRSTVAALKAFLQVPWLKINPITLMNENKGILGVNVGHLWDQPAMLRHWFFQILKWQEEGKIHPMVDRSFPLEDAALAHHYIQDRKNVGKVLLVP